MNQQILPYPRSRKYSGLIFTCFFLSGMTGLIYQVLWTRMIIRIIGCAPFAVSIILTVFMAGLGLGSYLASRRIDRIRQPEKLIRLYGILELIVGGYALLIPILTRLSGPMYSLLYNRLQDQFFTFNLLTFVGCFVLLVLPVVCMGATLPILCRFYVRHLDQLGTYAGRLYGINTFGAAAGAMAAGFWLIQWLGITGALHFAVAINALIGITAVLLSLGSFEVTAAAQTATAEQATAAEQTATAEPIPDETAQPDFAGVRIGALAIFGISGFCAMAYEVIWTKLLGLIVGPTTFSFTIVLVTFIVGLALGSIIFGRLADKTGRAFSLLVASQVAAALFALVNSHYFGNSQLFYAKLLSRFQDNFTLLSLAKIVSLFAAMIWPTLFLGATFPLVSKIYTQSLSRVGHSIGYAYMINTVGAVLGSFCAGFVLIPLLGKEKSLSLVIGAQFLTAGAAVLLAVLGRKEKRWRLAWLAVPAGLGLALCWQYPAWNRQLLAHSKYHRFDEIQVNLDETGWWQAIKQGTQLLAEADATKMIYYGDGIGGFVSVQGSTNIFNSSEYWLTISGKPDTSTKGDMATNTLLANLPMLFHPHAQDVMVLGLASGITAGEVLNYPVQRLDILEISPQVVKASDAFKPWSNDPLADPRTHLIIQDARAHLEHTRQTYDAIISEPSNAWMAGLAALFTTDFFQQVKNRLKEHGMFVQFIYTYETDWDSIALIGRSFAEVFPNSMLVSTEPSGYSSDYLMVGFKTAGDTLNVENGRKNLPYIAKSRNVRLAKPELLYRMIMSENLPELFGPGPRNSDDHPRLEFAAPKMMYKYLWENIEKIHTQQRLRPETIALAKKMAEDPQAQVDFAEYALSVYQPFRSMVDLSRLNEEQKERLLKLVAEYAASNQIENLTSDNDDDNNVFSPVLMHICRLVQIQVLEINIEQLPDKAKGWAFRGDLLTVEGRFDEAIDSYHKALAIKSDWADLHLNLGVAYVRKNDLESAIAQFREVINLNPEHALAHKYLDLLLAKQNN